MKNIFKWIILFLIMWIVITVFYTVGISLYTGALLGAIILSGIFGILYYYMFVRSKKEPEPESETKLSSSRGWFIPLLVLYIILVVGVIFFELENTNIGRIILIPGKIFINLLEEFLIPAVESMFERVEEN